MICFLYHFMLNITELELDVTQQEKLPFFWYAN